MQRIMFGGLGVGAAWESVVETKAKIARSNGAFMENFKAIGWWREAWRVESLGWRIWVGRDFFLGRGLGEGPRYLP